MMLDAKATFDEVIAKHAGRRDTGPHPREPDLQAASRTRSQALRYMAMEKLFELHQEDRRYDLLVLDTPPTRNSSTSSTRRAASPSSSKGARSRCSCARRARDAAVRPRDVDDVLDPAPRHGCRPARGHLRVLPGVQRDGRRLPGAREARQRAPRRPAHRVSGCAGRREPIEEAVYFHRKLVEASSRSRASSSTRSISRASTRSLRTRTSSAS